MRVELEPAWILHRRPYRETSLLLDVLSLNYGRVGLVAKGARRPSRKRRLNTEPFQPLRLSWAGRGELMNLIGAEAATGSSPLRGRRLWSGLYINELLVHLVQRNDPCPEVFQQYARLVTELAGELDEQQLLRGFEVKLLHHLGYGLVLDMEILSGQAVEASMEYEYLLDAGPRLCTEQLSANGIHVSGATLQALAAGNFPSAQIKRSSKLFMRAILRHHLGGRTLHSTSLFRRGPAS